MIYLSATSGDVSSGATCEARHRANLRHDASATAPRYLFSLQVVVPISVLLPSSIRLIRPLSKRTPRKDLEP